MLPKRPTRAPLLRTLEQLIGKIRAPCCPGCGRVTATAPAPKPERTDHAKIEGWEHARWPSTSHPRETVWQIKHLQSRCPQGPGRVEVKRQQARLLSLLYHLLARVFRWVKIFHPIGETWPAGLRFAQLSQGQKASAEARRRPASPAFLCFCGCLLLQSSVLGS